MSNSFETIVGPDKQKVAATTVNLAVNRVQAVRELPNFRPLQEIVLKRRDACAPFVPWQVEKLLNEANDVIERAWRERTIFNDLRLKALETRLTALSEARELELIEKRLQVTPGATPTFKLEAEAAKLDHDAAVLAARMDMPARPGVDDYTTWNGVWDQLSNAQQESSTEKNKAGAAGFAADRFKTFLEKRVRDEGIPGLKARADLAQADSERFEDTAKYLREIANIKAEAFNEGGALDLIGQLESMVEQMQVDLADIYLRVEAVQIGLEAYFGYSTNKIIMEGITPTLEEMTVWMREAVSCFAAAAQHHQTVIHVIRLSTACPDFRAALKRLQASQRAVFEFDWDEKVLPTHERLRFAGVAMVLLAQEPTFARATITLHGASLAARTLVPPIYIGNICTDSAHREPVVFAAESHRNLPPKGGWEIELAAAGKFNTITDILVQVQLTYNAV